MTPKLPIITPKQLVWALERSGFVIHRQKGSHVFLYHPEVPGKIVAVPYHNRDLKKGTLKGILRQAGMDVETLLNLL
ncbi:MAG: type II toxin-antitoxin system HicA family toxin [bacterium]